MSTCYFFGTFNPIHVGHLMMANQALALLGDALGPSSFETVTFVPAGNPPHRRHEPSLLPPEQRFKLIQAALHKQPGLRVTDIELTLAKQGAVTYTLSVLEALFPTWPEARIPILMGQDNFFSLPTWHGLETLLQHCHFIVLSRPDYPQALPELPEALKSQLVWTPLPAPELSISATHIRTCCQRAEGDLGKTSQALNALMPDAALEYLLDNELYCQWLG